MPNPWVENSNMKRPFVRYILGQVSLFACIACIGVPIAVSILVMSTQIATYGVPVKILVSLGLAVTLVLGSRYAIRSRNRARLEWPSSWVVAGLVVVAVFLLINHLLVRGIAVGIWDAEASYYPFQTLVADYARQGRLLHWDPWSSTGVPLGSDPEVGAFSPLNLAIGLLTGGTSLGFRFYWLLVWSLGGVGILMLGRHLKAPAWGSAAIAIGFLFSGIYTGNAQHTSCVVAFSFLPLIVWRLDKALLSQRVLPAVEAGGLWGLSALSGYPGLTIITGFFCALWAIGRMAFPESPLPESVSGVEIPSAPTATRAKFGLVLGTLGILVVVGTAILSPTYYAFFTEGTEANARARPLNREIAVTYNALEPGAISTFASSYLATLKAENQIHGDGQMWPSTDLSMCNIYSSAVVTLFALVSILMRPRDRWRWWLVTLGGLSLACAMGGSLPLRGWLYDWIYPTRFFRHSALFRVYFVFTISVMALVGIRDAESPIRKATEIIRRRRLVIAASVCAVAAFAVFLEVVRGADTAIRFSQAVVTWLVVSGGWLATLGAVSLLTFRPDSLKLSYPAIILAITASDAFLTGTISQSSMMSTEVEDVARWQSLDERHSGNIDLTDSELMREHSPCSTSMIINPRTADNINPSIACPRSDQLITKIPVLESYPNVPNLFDPRMSHPTIKEMAVGSDRIWFCREAVQVEPSEDCFSAFARRAEALRGPPLVIHSRQDPVSSTDQADNIAGRTYDLEQIGQLPTCNRLPIRLFKYNAEELTFYCNSPADGWLLVTDRWGPAWRVEVNGKSSELFAANFIFRAIRVMSGENTIRFTYHPPLFPWLLILSWTTLGGMAVWSVSSAVVRIRKSSGRFGNLPLKSNDR